jgi:hypothetical protein
VAAERVADELGLLVVQHDPLQLAYRSHSGDVHRPHLPHGRGASTGSRAA